MRLCLFRWMAMQFDDLMEEAKLLLLTEEEIDEEAPGLPLLWWYEDRGVGSQKGSSEEIIARQLKESFSVLSLYFCSSLLNTSKFSCNKRSQ